MNRNFLVGLFVVISTVLLCLGVFSIPGIFPGAVHVVVLIVVGVVLSFILSKYFVEDDFSLWKMIVGVVASVFLSFLLSVGILLLMFMIFQPGIPGWS
jgi:hypothetical protein